MTFELILENCEKFESRSRVCGAGKSGEAGQEVLNERSEFRNLTPTPSEVDPVFGTNGLIG